MTKKEIQKIKPNYALRTIIEDAKKIGMEVVLVSETEKIVSLEYKERIKYFKTVSSTFNTSLSATFAANKQLTKEILQKNGFSVAEGYSIENLAGLKSLIKNKKIKFPLVIKPNELMEGMGVSVNLNSIKDCKDALSRIKEMKDRRNKNIIVENYYHGRDYRVLVFDGKVVAALERVHPEIKGDGNSTIKYLLDREIKRKKGKLYFDDEVKRSVRDKGYKLNDVLKHGEKIRIRQNANISTGAVSKNVINKVSPYFKKIAVGAVRALGLGIGGVDIMTENISSKNISYIVIEINGCPDLSIHAYPDFGRPVNVPKLLLKNMFNLKR